MLKAVQSCFGAFAKLPLSERYVPHLSPATPDETVLKTLDKFYTGADVFFFCVLSQSPCFTALLPFASADLIDAVDGRFLHHVVRNKVNVEELCKARKRTKKKAFFIFLFSFQAAEASVATAVVAAPKAPAAVVAAAPVVAAGEKERSFVFLLLIAWQKLRSPTRGKARQRRFPLSPPPPPLRWWILGILLPSIRGQILTCLRLCCQTCSSSSKRQWRKRRLKLPPRKPPLRPRKPQTASRR